MNVYNLPGDIVKHKKDRNADIIFHHYKVPANSLKGKGVLSKNAISLVITGTKTMHFANNTVTIKEGEFHFLSVGNCIVTMNLAKTKPFESILIFFDDKVLAEFYLKYKTKVAAIRKSGKIPIEPYVAFQKDEFVNNFIRSLKVLIQSESEVSMEMRRLKFEELMLYLIEKHPLRLLSFPLSKTRELEDLEVRKAVEISIPKNISIEDLAFLCNMSPSTFKRRFGKIYGTSPSRWLLVKRMELAKELIAENGNKPSEVYHKVGYENHSSFTQSFKQFFGVTPKEFYAGRLNH